MSLIIDGNGDIFNFKLSDKKGHSHFYEVYAPTYKSAIKLAQKWFVDDYGHKATHLEKNVTGFPITRNT